MFYTKDDHSAFNFSESMENVYEKKDVNACINKDEEIHHVFGVIETNTL